MNLISFFIVLLNVLLGKFRIVVSAELDTWGL